MQQINLYQSQFRPKQIILPARQFLLIAFVMIAIFCVLSAYLHFEQISQQAIVTNQQEQLAKKETRLIALREQLAKYEENPLLKAELASLQQTYEENQDILDYLKNEQLGNQIGFSSTLEALSEQHISGLWLNQFSLLNAGQHTALNGQTSDATKVPEYIDSLGRSEQFNGKTFSVFQLQQPEQDSLFQFKLFTNQAAGAAHQ
jgi:hypothetical protein